MVDLPPVKRDLTSGRKTLAYELSHKVAELLNSWKLRSKENVKIEGRHVPSTNSLFQK